MLQQHVCAAAHMLCNSASRASITKLAPQGGSCGEAQKDHPAMEHSVDSQGGCGAAAARKGGEAMHPGGW